MMIATNSRGFYSVSIHAFHNIDRAEAWWEVRAYLHGGNAHELFNEFPSAVAFFTAKSRELDAVSL